MCLNELYVHCIQCIHVYLLLIKSNMFHQIYYEKSQDIKFYAISYIILHKSSFSCGKIMELIVCLHANSHCIFYLESTCEVTIAKQCTIILINRIVSLHGTDDNGNKMQVSC